MAEGKLNQLLNDLIEILGEKSRKGMKNKKYSGYQTEIRRILGIHNMDDKVTELQFMLGQDRLLDKIRKSINTSKQRNINNLKTRINTLYPKFNEFYISSREFGFNIETRTYIRVKFFTETIKRLRNGLQTVDINRYLNVLFPNNITLRNIGKESERIGDLIGNRNSIFYRFKDRLEFLKKRSVGSKRKRHYQTLIEYLENLEKFGGNYKNKTTRPTRTKNKTEFELDEIRRINPDLYYLLLQNFTSIYLERVVGILMNMPNKELVYRYPYVDDTISFLKCILDNEEKMEMILKGLPPLDNTEKNLSNRLRGL